jgi:hypothetical protein
MATIRKQVFGEIHGGISSIKIKYRNGKPYVASKPGKFNTGKDPVTLFKKNQGKFIGKLSREIYRIEILKKIWSLNNVKKGYTYQQIWARNYKSIKCSDLSGVVTLTPLPGFIPENPVTELTDHHSGKITVAPFGDKLGFNPAIEKKILAVGVIILTNLIGMSDSHISFLTINSEPIDLDLFKPVNINFTINPLGDPSLRLSQIKKSYITLITLDESLSPIRCSQVITSS